MNSLAGRTKESIENINQKVVELSANVNSIEAELANTKKSNDDINNVLFYIVMDISLYMMKILIYWME